jgi:HPr kinase/phosphorylase
MAGGIHGGAVAYAGIGCLILGQSGSGKSRLMAEMIGLGARLIADDQVEIIVQAGMLMGAAPKELMGIMEMRGLGLIRVPDYIPRHVLHVAVEFTDEEIERIPEPTKTRLLGHDIPVLKVPPTIGAAGLLMYIKAMQEGRSLPPDWRPGA